MVYEKDAQTKKSALELGHREENILEAIRLNTEDNLSSKSAYIKFFVPFSDQCFI